MHQFVGHTFVAQQAGQGVAGQAHHRPGQSHRQIIQQNLPGRGAARARLAQRLAGHRGRLRLLPLFRPAGTPQAFSVRLTDRSGASATVRTRPGEPALTFPVGIVTEDDVFEDGLFSGRVPMTTIRLLLSDFSGVDLSQISQITLLFDQTDSGALFLGDLELVRE